MSSIARRIERLTRRSANATFGISREHLRLFGIEKFRRRQGKFGRFVRAMRRELRRREREFLYGVPGGSAPVGVLHTDTNTIPLTAASHAPTYADILKFEREIERMNHDGD